MAKDTFVTIKCPHCGCSYLPAEIFIPDALVGHPKEIEKDINGKILNCYGTMWNPIEYYTCDKCDTRFKIKAETRFITSIDHKNNFTQPFKMSIKKPDLFLSED